MFLSKYRFFSSQKDIMYDTKIGPAVNIPVSISDLRHCASELYLANESRVIATEQSGLIYFSQDMCLR